ncbi:MAG: hypothetical protein AAGC61_08155 [Microbacterium sp.]
MTSVGDGPYVSVFCVGTPEAPHDKWRIATFYPDVFGDGVIWMPHQRSYYEPGVARTIHIAGSVSQRLDGNAWIPVGDRSYNYDSPTFRMRWNVGCRECGMRKVIAAPKTFYPAFTALAQAGIREIELLHLIHSSPRTEPQ